MRRAGLFVAALLLFGVAPLGAQDRDTKVRNDREFVQELGGWVYNDLDAGLAEAKKTGKPLFVVIRCIPWQDCQAFDGQVVRRDSRVKDLMERFVCVRLVQANGMDLSLFQFDYDLTFAVFFLNADKTIYGRYGSRSALRDATRDISIEGLRAAMEGALELHENYPANKAALAAKRGPKPRYARAELYPTLLGKFTASLDYEGNVARSCIHCHQVRAAERRMIRDAGERIPEESIHPWPMPEVIGLKLDPKTKATVEEVEAESAAARDGFRAGDEIVALDGQPILSIADVQWVLHSAKPPARLPARVLRAGRELALELTLDEDWRHGSEISWRPTTWDLRRMATGGMVLEDLPPEGRKPLRLDEDQMALHVKHVGEYGDHAVAKKAGFQVGDVVVSFDGQRKRMSETDLLAYVLQKRMRGAQVPVTVLREGRRIALTLRMQ